MPTNPEEKYVAVFPSPYTNSDLVTGGVFKSLKDVKNWVEICTYNYSTIIQ